MCRLPRERITTIYNPVVTDELQALARVPLDHPWFQPGAPPVVLGAGRLEEQKDFQTLIRAFARIRRQRLARLVILGEGGLRGALAALAAAIIATLDNPPPCKPLVERGMWFSAERAAGCYERLIPVANAPNASHG